jgi:hypothetical protein
MAIPERAAGSFPDFLLIGAMRCGTTTLWELVGRHERVFLPARKELHFFDDRDGAFAQGPEAYAAFFADAPAGAVRGESSPSYLYVPGTAERIRAIVPDVRLIAILRDPVERAWSHYWFNVRRGREWLSFEKALDREDERTRSPKDLRWGPWFSYVGRGLYVEQLRRYESVFPREQLLVVLLDDLLRDPAAVMRTVFAHIALDAVELETEIVPERNQLRRPRSRRLHLIGSRAAQWGRTGRTPAHRTARYAAALTRRLNTSGSRPSMRPETRARLLARFAASDAELAAWLGRPLPWAPPGR